MPKFDSGSLRDTIDLASQALSLSFKLGVIAGATCLLFYCRQIHYFPTGVTIGDSFLFLLLAVSFGFIYGLVLAGLTSLGIFVIYALRIISWLTSRVRIKMRIGDLAVPTRPGFPILASTFALIGVDLIYTLYKLDPAAGLILPLISFALAGLVWMLQDSVPWFVKQTSLASSTCTQDGNTKPKELHKTRVYAILILIVFLPLFFGGVSGLILKAGMRFANLRQGHSVIWLRAPYSEMLNAKSKRTKRTLGRGFTKFSNIDILFSGFGQETVIEFLSGRKVERIVVPSKSIVIVRPVRS